MLHIMVAKFLRFLAEDGPTSPKHVLWPHPVTTFIVHYTVVTIVVFVAHDLMVSYYYNDDQRLPEAGTSDNVLNTTSKKTMIEHIFQPTHCLSMDYFPLDAPTTTQALQPEDDDEQMNDHPHGRQRQRIEYAKFMVAYAVGMFAWRMYAYHSIHAAAISKKEDVRANKVEISKKLRYVVFYEFQFLCNVTLVVSPIALSTSRPTVATAFCVAVGIDQLLWYVDLLGYFIFTRGKFPVGVTKYLFWPGVTWQLRVTSTHHLWTLPVLMIACEGIHLLAGPLSILIVTINVLLSRFMTPIAIIHEDKIGAAAASTNISGNSALTMNTGASNKVEKCHKAASDAMNSVELKYLNLNLSHELWKDIKLWIVASAVADNPRPVVYLFRLLWRWYILNVLVFGVLFSASKILVNPNTGINGAPIC